MAATGSTKGRRFAAACGVLSRCVKAAEAWPATTVALPLMPGADVSVQDEHAPAAADGAQMTIFYGGRVLVLEEVPADMAAELLRAAAAAAASERRVRPAYGEEGVAAAVHGEAQGKGRRAGRPLQPTRRRCALACALIPVHLMCSVGGRSN
uniref:Uncharacterized protein n=1 Tax=Avena sativa TaxID=4498 RepID=A0ACD5WI18_AVESA